MKKILFTLLTSVFCGSMALAQNGLIVGTVVDASQQPISGMAVFNFGIVNNQKPQDFQKDATWPKYTNHLGTFTIGYGSSTLNFSDTIAVGTFDCDGNFYYEDVVVHSSNQHDTIVIQLTGCTPGACDVVVNIDSFPNWSNKYLFEAISLRDSNSVFPGSNHGSIIHEWTVDGNPIPNKLYNGPNYDTVMIDMNSLPSDFEFCYRRTASCSAICDTVGTILPPSPSLQCDAHFFVDTVNSLHWQNDIVLWENSSTDSGQIVSYLWDFGDGGTSAQQYPTHTYADTGIYNICLSITAVYNGDTCVSTHCDSIGFDANGNLHKSTGFTVSVMDPSTVGQKEVDMKASFDLYPNPSHGDAMLQWNTGMDVKRVEILSMNGALVRSFEPVQDFVEIGSMKSGAYLIRVQSAEGATTMKMIVK